MTPEEFRAAGHLLIDWVADFRAGIGELPVQAQVRPGEVRAAMPSAPTAPQPFEDLLAQMEQVILPGSTHFQHPRFFGFFPANMTLPAVLGDLLSTGLGSIGISWQASPALSEVETVVCDWVRQLVGLDDGWTSVIQDTASGAVLVALICARERAGRGAMFGGGLAAAPAPLVVYHSAEAHSSVRKAALLAGFGADHTRAVPVDDWTRDLDVVALAAMMAEDRAAGRVPTAVVATVGTTGCTAFDPVGAVAQVAAGYDAWVHVDAAMAGSAMILPEMRHLWEGVSAADSIAWNPHKWWGAALECSLFHVRDVSAVTSVMGTNPSYLRDADDEAAGIPPLRDLGIPLGRRFRALKLWMLLALDGPDALAARMRRDLENAQWLLGEVNAAPGWEVLAPVRLQTLCVVHRPAGSLDGEALDRHTLRWARQVNASGVAYLTPALMDGRWMVRVSIGAESTTREDVATAWAAMRAAAEGDDDGGAAAPA